MIGKFYETITEWQCFSFCVAMTLAYTHYPIELCTRFLKALSDQILKPTTLRLMGREPDQIPHMPIINFSEKRARPILNLDGTTGGGDSRTNTFENHRWVPQVMESIVYDKWKIISLQHVELKCNVCVLCLFQCGLCALAIMLAVVFQWNTDEDKLLSSESWTYLNTRESHAQPLLVTSWSYY